MGEYLIEELARIPVEVEYASELRYRNPPLDHNTLLFAITQSGETADTLAALREMKRKGHPTLAICNVVGSTIAREADGGIYLHAGPEIGVASTKAFTSQCTVLAHAGPVLRPAAASELRRAGMRRSSRSCRSCRDKVARALAANDAVAADRREVRRVQQLPVPGPAVQLPDGAGGALKLKEISYIHAEGYPAAEMKHGPIALVDENTPSVFLMPQGRSTTR